VADLQALTLVKRARNAEEVGMGLTSRIAVVACLAMLVVPASALGANSAGSREQIAWVRRAATNFVTAELEGNGAGACTILNAPLRTTQNHRTCEQRWSSKLARVLHEPGGRARLRAEEHAIASAVVTVHGDHASIDLPTPLMGESSRFLWTENCWMLTS